MKEIKLNTRQWKVYHLLRDNSDKWLSQYEIVARLKEEYGEYTQDPKVFHDSIQRAVLTDDIRQINQSAYIQKIILSSSKGIKIANKEEYEVYSISRWKAIKRMISRLAWKDDKAKLNGQMKLVFGESMARDYYETFVNDYNEELE
jgi:hypothetical protein